MTILRAGVCGVVLLIAAYIVVMNWACVIASWRNRRKGIDKHHSTVPLITLILAGLMAYPLYPFATKWWILLIPAMDIGNWMLIIGVPSVMIAQKLTGKGKE
ncbi:MAG: hypothetical protein JW808_05425 [Victivallales bacterium]|nr:hypothetical protein [Victivallales bacterium]